MEAHQIYYIISVCVVYILIGKSSHIVNFPNFDSKSYRTNEYYVYLCASMRILIEKQMIDYKVCDQAPSRNESRKHNYT